MSTEFQLSISCHRFNRYTKYMAQKTTSLPKWVRVLLPGAIILVWLALGGIGGPYFGKISQVATNDQSSFLPASAESTKVSNELQKFQTQKSIPAIVVFTKNDQKLPDDAVTKIKTETLKLSSLPEVSGSVSPPIVSDDGKAALVVINAKDDADYRVFVPELRNSLTSANLGVDFKITGPFGFLYDLGKAFEGIDGILLLVALAVVFVILLVVYRSPTLPFLVLFNSMFALSASILVVYYLAKADIVTINGQVQGILFILVIGAATDYSLLFISRYREELTRHKQTYQAILTSWKRSIEPIAAAGATVVAGLLCLLLSDLNSNKALGPVGAVGIVMAVISSMTLLPSLLLMGGRKLFWPRMPHFNGEDAALTVPKNSVWPRVARLVESHTRTVWIVSGLTLLVLSAGILQLRADGVAQSDLILGPSDAREGQKLVDKHFPGGSGAPTQVIVAQNNVDKVVAAIEKDSDVATVYARANNSPTGTIPYGKTADKITAQIQQATKALGPQFAFNPFGNATPKVIDGEILLEVTLKSTSDSIDAQHTVERLRTAIHDVDASASVGGAAAIQLDVRKAALHDQMVVIPAVLVVITIILTLLLRAVFAPLLLLATTIVSFTATLGVSALLFNHVFNFPGADPSIVLFGFIFLVALGIDYNIFLMTRVREESLHRGTRKGVLVGLVATGGVITSAGIVLASTFAALAVLPILFLAQLAFIVAFGVLNDTVIVRSLLVPALVYDIGRKVWWPAKKPRE